jgi:predicted metal-dependent phosphoesterase TrpH
MSRRTTLAGVLIGVALFAGTMADRLSARASRTMGGYQVLIADFHVHAFPQTWSTLSPWDTVIEAGRRGMDAIAIVPHDSVWCSKLARWFANVSGGPLVLTGEEITTPGYHLLAVGITETVAADFSAAEAIERVHRQGGVAIAAHPYRNMWPAYGADAFRILDGAEIVRPETPQNEQGAAELRAFSARAPAPLAAIGSSDYHGMGLIGDARTIVFARDRTEAGILEAVRARRTVVYDRQHAYGDPAMIALAATDPALDAGFETLPIPGAGRLLSRITGVLGLIVFVLTRAKS